MANATGKTPLGTADIATHIHDTFELQVIQANQTERSWSFMYEGRPYAHKSGSNVSVPLQGALPVDTTALPEKDDPDPLTATDSAVQLPCEDYGDWLLVTRRAIEDKDMNTIEGLAVALANQAVQKSDLIAGTAGVGGTNVRFVNGRADATALLATDVMSLQEFVHARAFLRRQGAPKYADGYYRAFLSTDQAADMFSDGTAAKGLIEQIKYANPEALITAEIGTFAGFKVYETGQLSIIDKDDAAGGAGAGGNTADRQIAVFCGKGYVGYTERRPIVFQGLEPANDNMKKLWKMLWDGRFGWGRIKEGNALRIESRSALAVNP